MLAKTKMTNEKLIMNKTNTKGLGYTKPEQLSKNIQTGVRAKKEADAGLRAQLEA